MKKLKQGLIQVYTGNGKGKTTAAFGLALRAAGAGLKVRICQFIKGKPCGETKAIARIPNVKISYYGRGCFIKGKPKMNDMRCAQKGLKSARQTVMSGKYDIVILDEINVAAKIGLIKPDDIIVLIDRKPKDVEIVLTGRGCPPAILKRADLVTEMRALKHPFRRGITARRGIEY